MSRKELVSEEGCFLLLTLGLRLDGRHPHDIRRWEGKINVVTTADGSAYLAQGNTKVIGATDTSKSSYLKPKISVNVTWNTATFSDAEQRSRPHHLSGSRDMKTIPDRRIISFISVIKDCLEHSIIATTLPNAHVDVHINILAADGSILSCVMNAISLALMDAGLPMLDVISSVSVGLATLPSFTSTTGKTGKAHEMLTREYTSIVDVSSQEEFIPVLTCAFLPKYNNAAFFHLEAKVALSELASMVETAEKASIEVQKRLKEFVITHYSK